MWVPSPAPPAIKAACTRAIETNSCLSSLTSRAVSEFWKWPLARQTDSQFWTHSKSTDCMGREVNTERTARTCPLSPWEQETPHSIRARKACASGPSCPDSFCLCAFAGPTFTWARQMAPLSVRFLPRAALGCSLARGWSACFSEKPKVPSDLPEQRPPLPPATPLASSGICCRPAVRCEQRARHQPCDAIQSRAAMSRGDPDLGRPMPSPEGKALPGFLKAVVSSHWLAEAGV